MAARASGSAPTDGPCVFFGQFAVVYVVGGGGKYRDANGYRHTVTPGDLIWVFPKLGHSYGPSDSASWNEIYICFHGPIFNLWMKSGLINVQRPVWCLEPIEYWLARFRWVLSGGLRFAGRAVRSSRFVDCSRRSRRHRSSKTGRRGRQANRLDLSLVSGTVALADWRGRRNRNRRWGVAQWKRHGPKKRADPWRSISAAAQRQLLVKTPAGDPPRRWG